MPLAIVGAAAATPAAVKAAGKLRVHIQGNIHAGEVEGKESALILHVTDVSSPRHAEQDSEVEKVLADLGVDDRPRLHVFNKVDRLGEEERAALRPVNGNVFVSALREMGLEKLLERIDEELPVDPLVRLQLNVPLSDGRILALVHGLGRVAASEVRDSMMWIDAEVPQSVARRLETYRDGSPHTPPAGA